MLNEPIEEKKIVIDNLSGHFAGHGKYIVEGLLNIRSDLDIVWVSTKPEIVLPKGVRLCISSDEKQYIYEMETAHIWITSTELLSDKIVKRKGQIYIHTKHWASVTLKRFYFDSSTLISFSKESQKRRSDFEKLDYIITGSEFDEESCKRGFLFDGEFIRAGSPRTDMMFRNKSQKNEILDRLRVASNKKILLYAPTYRFQTNGNSIDETHVDKDMKIDFFMLKEAIGSRFGGEWVIVLRLHPSVSFEHKEIKEIEYVIDATQYSDEEELCFVCDAMISDYSSIMFEPAFVGKPIFLYAPDKDEYINKEYDLLIDYDSLPFPIATDNDQLAHNIVCFNEELYKDKVAAFLDYYGVHEDGHASERAAQFISSIIDNTIISDEENYNV